MKHLVTLFIFFSSLISAKENALYVCAIFQNEARFLDEWVRFHLDQGVEKIYLYNNKSEDDYMSVLKKYISQGTVEVKNWKYDTVRISDWNKIQCSAYLDCIKKVKKKCEWVAFIDIDEFLFSPTGKPLMSVLREYNDVDAMAVNWVCYGTSGVARVPNGGKMLDYLSMRSEFSNPDNKHIKSIVRPEKVVDCVSPHNFVLVKGGKFVNEKREAAKEQTAPFSVEKFRINHYWSRDGDFFFGEKLKRRQDWFHENVDRLIQKEASYNLIYDPILVGK